MGENLGPTAGINLMRLRRFCQLAEGSDLLSVHPHDIFWGVESIFFSGGDSINCTERNAPTYLQTHEASSLLNRRNGPLAAGSQGEAEVLPGSSRQRRATCTHTHTRQMRK